MEEPKVIVPILVDDAEIVDRVVYEPSFFCEGRLSPSAFDLTQEGETYISVFRHDYYQIAGIKLPKARVKGDSPSGVAQLTVKDIRAIQSPNKDNTVSVDVKAQKSRLYPFHAGIFTTIDGTPVKGGEQHTTPWFMYVQKELVKRANYIPLAKLIPEATAVPIEVEASK